MSRRKLTKKPYLLEQSTRLIKGDYLKLRRKIKPNDLNNIHFGAWRYYLKQNTSSIASVTEKTKNQLFWQFLNLEEKDVYKFALRQRMIDADSRIKNASFLNSTKTVQSQKNAIRLAIDKFDGAFLVTEGARGFHIFETKDILEIIDLCVERLVSKSSSDKQKANIKVYLKTIRQALIPRGRQVWQELGHDDWFSWPKTDVLDGITQEKIMEIDWKKEGLLSVLGYHVGYNSWLSEKKRQELLSCAFEVPIGHLKKGLDKEWGAPRSAARLKKIACSIAAFTRNAKRKKNMDYRQAIDEWESDLAYLYKKYYLDYFQFAWPSC